MSEPTAPACPQCGMPRAADGTPACSCGRLASEAHRDIRTAQAEAAEDFDPVRIRPFVKVGDDSDPVAAAQAGEREPQPGVPEEGDAPTAAPAEPHHAPAAPFDDETLLGEQPPSGEQPPLDEQPFVDEQPPGDRTRAGRRWRRAVLGAAVGAVAAAVLVTVGIIGGLFSYEAPSRDGSGPEDIRAGLPEAAAGAKTSPAVNPSLTASTASPSETAPPSPTASPTESLATPTGSGTPTRTPSNSDATVTAAPAPTPTAGQPPVLGLGDQGTEVTELQLRLRQIGFYNGDADGDYDPEVQSAVRGYQLTRVLLEDESGVYGEATRTSLESETSEP
ncbi:peptidoglycan-binding protein [Streptomyces europaeiscabiei]|uniref:Peptidoglycan-binding protein n=1 Tax=Streptomyces europaeiscabiei TaxID=146819 RepID=A0AAJ2UJL6_9ACTN|nr:peptidoglycan-binding protein [Streptomyces europaeiscabiei]MDX3128984.1 peptidoglycan-binding protein [Streptomyces europaeiscabiei]